MKGTQHESERKCELTLTTATVVSRQGVDPWHGTLHTQASVIKETSVARFLLCATFPHLGVTPFFMKFTLPPFVQPHPHCCHTNQNPFPKKSPLYFYMITTILYLYLSSGDTWRTGKGILCDLIMSCCNCQYFVIWTYDEPLPIRILIHHYAYWRSRARKHKQINPADRECKKQS